MKKVALLVLLLVLVPKARPDTITEHFSFVPTVTPFLIGSSSIPDFNPAKGTLQSVEIVLTGNSVGAVSIGNTTGAGQSYSFSVSTLMTLLDPHLGSLFSIAPSFSGGLVVPGDAIGKSALVISPSVSDSIILSSGFGLYEGTGMYVLGLLSPGAVETVKGAGVFLVAASSSANAAGGTVIYDYTPASPVPESATVAMLGIGLAIVGWKLRREAR